MFACAHPAIERGMRAPLILQTVLGLTAEEIAAAFLIPPATMGQAPGARQDAHPRRGHSVPYPRTGRTARAAPGRAAVRAYLRGKLAPLQQA